MLKTYPNLQSFLQADHRDSDFDDSVRKATQEIIGEVRRDGDAALRRLTRRFDRVELEDLRVEAGSIARAQAALDAQRGQLFRRAIDNVRAFHEKQMPAGSLDEQEGCLSGLRYTPVDSAGLYIPGGRAGYPSTVIMTAVPAQIAGVGRIVFVSPPGSDGKVNPLVLAVAGMLGIGEIYSVGGAQAIAALAYGTGSIQRVDKIVGPGNAYVNEAKRQVFGAVGIDALAGPTEIVVLADESANAEWVVRDMFAQAEHDPETSAICVTTSVERAEEIVATVKRLLPQSERREILEASIGQKGAVVVVKNMQEAAEAVNYIAPEHLEIVTADPQALLPSIRNAGAIFLGPYTPAVTGDYCGGPNHVLPTGRSARFSSPLGVLDFMKYSSVFSYSEQAFQRQAELIADFAALEGLLNHKAAVTCRTT